MVKPANWRHADTLFIGGSEQVKALTGRRVRARCALLGANVYDPDNGPSKKIDVAMWSSGFVANPHPTRADVLIALPRPHTPGAQATTLEELTRRGGFDVIFVNYRTFREQFDIET